MKRPWSTGILALSLSVIGVQSAAAQQTAAFMNVPGIPGESVQQAHENWIDLVSVTQTFSTAAKGNACSVAVAKRFDRSGPLLWAAAATSQVFTTITIDVDRVVDGVLQRAYNLTLTNAAIAAISSNPTDLIEQLTLFGSSATLRYYPQNPDGSLGTPVTSTIACK